MDMIRQTVADVGHAFRGSSPRKDVQPARTIISHREFDDDADDFDDMPSSLPSKSALANGDPDAETEAAIDAKIAAALDDSLINGADELFGRAASATPMPSTEKSIKPVFSTSKASSSKSPAKTKPKPKPDTKPAKTPKSAKPTTAAADKSKTTWAGEIGPDNAITVDGEQQWEIADIVGQEGDVLLVKWKGWKGIWEEDHAVIAESAPELVKEWESRVEKMGKEKAKRKGQGKKGAAKTKVAKTKTATKGKSEAAGTMTARKAATKEAGGRGKAKKVVEKKGAKVTKAPKKATAPAAPAKSPKKTSAATAATAPASKSPKKAAASPKKTAGKGAVAPAKKRGRPPRK